MCLPSINFNMYAYRLLTLVLIPEFSSDVSLNKRFSNATITNQNKLCCETRDITYG